MSVTWPKQWEAREKRATGFTFTLGSIYLWPKRRVLFPPSFRGKPLNCSAIAYHFCATVVLPRGWAPRWGNTPKGFPSIFLTQDRLFSCSSDKKERAYLGASITNFWISGCLWVQAGRHCILGKGKFTLSLVILRVCLSSPIYLLHASSPSVSAVFSGRDAFSSVLEIQRVLLCSYVLQCNASYDEGLSLVGLCYNSQNQEMFL